MAIDRQKGTCKHCRVKFKKVNNFYLYCESTPECKEAGKEFQLNARIKSALKKVRNDEKEKFAVMKENIKTLSQWKNDLQKEINAIVREIDKGHPCISSNRNLGKSFDAGHMMGRQSFPEIRYHLMNIYAQSVEQNQHKSGNPIGFMDGLEQTFGKEHLELVMALKSHPELRITIEEIKEKIAICRSILKWLKLQDRMFTTLERLELREKFNNEINIYKPS